MSQVKKNTANARSTTMADVAKLAGVGKMTVSRLLTGSARVSKETADRVHRAIRTLNYQPNELARSLRSVHSKTIALILPYLYDSFFATCAHAVSTVATQHGYSVLITTSDERATVEQQAAAAMLRRRIDGLIIIPAPHDGYLRGSQFSHVPVVTCDRPSPDSRFDSVLVNNQGGARACVAHLIEHGHRRIAYLGLDKHLYTMESRYAGYRDAMLRAGCEPELNVECTSQDDTVTIVQSMLSGQNAPTAIFVANNLSMRYVLHALSMLRVEVPNQIALAGFDDFDVADVLQPALTVVRQPVYQVGEMAANLLFQRIARGDHPGKGHRVVLPVELVIRRSCGCSGDVRSTVQVPESVENE